MIVFRQHVPFIWLIPSRASWGSKLGIEAASQPVTANVDDATTGHLLSEAAILHIPAIPASIVSCGLYPAYPGRRGQF